MRRKSVIILAAAVSFLLLGCESKQETAMMETPAIPVKVATPVVKDITTFIETIGTLEPSVFMEVRPQIDGTIVEVLITRRSMGRTGHSSFRN